MARQGDTITVSSMVFFVLNPADSSGTSNDNSVVLRLTWGQIGFPLVGDAERDAEASMLAAGLIPDVEILKAGYRGPRTASSLAFLAAAEPEVAIYMAGVNNLWTSACRGHRCTSGCRCDHIRV